ncbi:DUF3613 domain-containing protein [Pseudomonas sp. NA-150]|uniref:DUF3613 domain-containing protein n=1 Tax=Pseudomonas sp. NA-150 TaxID=3367525 RepID=UPI0037C7F5B1
MKRKILGCFCVLSVSASVWAIDQGPSSAQQQETELWLQLQPSATAASTVPQTMTQAERDLSFQRWLKSYTHDIPDFYEQKKGGEVPGGGQ